MEDLAGIEGVRATDTFMYLRLLKEAYTWSVAPRPPPTPAELPAARAYSRRSGCRRT